MNNLYFKISFIIIQTVNKKNIISLTYTAQVTKQLQSIMQGTQNKLRSTSIRSRSSKIEGKQSKSAALQIIPAQVVFKDIQINQFYEITIQIRNLTHKAMRIRIQQCSNQNFSVLYTMQPEIAPGLSMTAKIKYLCKQLKNQTQFIKVVCDQGTVMQLPVRVYRTESQIIFQPFINLGFVKCGKQHRQSIVIKNIGKAPGKIQFSHNHSPMLNIQPSNLTIPQKQQALVSLKFKTSEAGLFKGEIFLKSQSILVKDKIDIHATAVQFSRYIVDSKGGQTTTFDFRNLYSGQQSVIKGFLVNNSPKSMSFKSTLRKGYLVSSQEFALVQTPAQIGLEQSEKIMFMQPQFGVIQPFGQLQIYFICKTKVNYKDRVYTKTFALTSPQEQGAINSKKNSSDFKPENLHQYSIMVNVDEDEPIILQLKALTTCPQIKLQKDLFQFGDCFIKDTKEQIFTIQNKSNVSKAQISFNKIPNFSVIPGYVILRPLQKIQVKLIFQPKTIGKFDVVQKLIINKIYELEMRLFGIATHELKSMKKIKQLTDPKKYQPINTRVKAFSVAEKSFLSEMRKSTVQAQNAKLQLSNLMQNRQKFNIYLKQKRTDRLDKQKQQNVQKRWSLYQTKLKDLGPGRLQQKFDQEGIPVNPPIDYEFQSGMNDTKITRQQISLPAVTQKLFVTKHINDYEPLVDNNKRQKFNRAQTQSPKQILPQIPVNYNHRRQITSQLTPQQLILVEVMSNTLEFGQVYIKSKESRYFWIRNLTKKAISVEVRFSANELKNSYSKPQILKSGQDAGFQVVFYKDTLGQFKGQGKYIINGKYEFQMNVTATSTPVEIELNTNDLKFHFDDSSLEFSTEKELVLHNPGNSSAFFKFLLAKDKIFVPKTLQGTLQSKQTVKIPIVFTLPNPTTKKNQYTYTQRLVLKVLDGPQNQILCSYSNSDPKFTVKCQKFLSKPIIYLGHDFQDSIDIKNTSKIPIVMQIQANNNLQVFPHKFRLDGDELKKINIKFAAKIIGQFNISITLIPRGGQKKVIESAIKVIEPTLQFSSEQINMGTLIVQGVAGFGKFTLINKNQIPLPLIIDIRPRTIAAQNPFNIEDVTLRLIDTEQTLQVISPQKNKYTEHIGTQGQNLVGQSVDQEQFENSDSQQDQIIQKNQDEYRKFKLIVKPQKVYNFEFDFYPKATGSYDITIPMHIEKSIKIQNSPSIICQAIKPQFIFEPSIIDFKRKIVTKPDRCYPKFMNVTIHNIDQDEVSWELDDSEIKKEGIFEISQIKGKVKPNQKIQLKVSFNPYSVGQYHHKLPLFIHSAKIVQPLKYVDVIMKGTASLPNIFFNKRQVIMPVVPLGIQTFSTFKIINDGYQNCNLKHQFIDDVAGINVKVHFPQGPNIGITRKQLKVDLSWKFNKPMSFCLKLQFIDDMNRSFVIPVSGTTDNCIFTNYTYFLRNQGKFKIKSQGSLQLVEVNDNAASSFSLQRKNSAHSLKSNATNKSVMSYLGVAPINQSVLTNTLNYVLRYLNANLLTIPIHEFPQSLIENDGAQLFEIITFISNKAGNYAWKYNGGLKGIEKAKKLFEQYNELIKMLKIQGAHLNHIRPEYLLSFNDLNLFLGSLPQEKAKFCLPSLLKINRGLFNYLSIQSWITLLYQVFKIYVLTRVNPKNFKTHVVNSPQIPKHCLQQSNFSSVHQNILFFWVQQAIHQVLLQDRRLTNFDKDFKDGIAIGALLKKYANNQVLKRMKAICSTQQDFKSNATILCDSLKEIGLLNHIVPRDIHSPLQRQLLLFILNLYVYLPFYVPKQQPIVFKCILGQEVIRSIQLTNPSTKPVVYEAKYQGSDDFKMLSETKIRLQPKETFKFEVKFVSRVSAQVRGRIMFINVKQNSLTAAPLVFDLRSQITGKVSDRIWNISGVIYEQIEFNIDVNNKFTTAELVDFAITYETQYIFQSTRHSKSKSQKQKSPLSEQDQIQTIYGKVDNVKIRKNGMVTLTLNYIPTSLYTTRTIIYFCNPIVGQFQHQIIGTVQPPSVSAQIRPPVSLVVDQVLNWQYLINPKNDMILRAKKAIQSLKKRKNTKQQKQQKKTSTQFYINEEYYIQINPNPYVNAKQTIWVNERANNTQSDKTKDSKHHQALQSSENNPNNNNNKKGKQLVDFENKIPFTIICKNPVYEFGNYILVSNKSKTDVRRYRITFTIQPKPLRAILQMNVPARGEVTQNLPIVNNTDRDWNIKIQWQPDMTKNGQYFIVPSQYTNTFPVKKQSIGNFPITFKPKWNNKAEAKLIMSNPLTLDHFQYEIIGNGQDPLAQDHIQVKCQAKQRVKKQIWVKNPYSQKPINLRAQIDLLNCEGPAQLTIPSGGKQKFQFYVQPMLCGQYTGSITFYEEDGPQYLWYTLSVVTNYPEPYKVLDISTELRSKTVQKLYLPYKQSKQHIFQVIINGGGLSGSQEVTLKPNQDNFYCLQYLPLQVGQQKGSVIFINNEAGQILYEFNLSCHPKPPVIINDIKSPLGVSAYIKIQLQNPINRKVTLNTFNTNQQQFVLKSPVIKLQPYEKKTVEIQYIPASLDKIQNGIITFRSKEVGDWVFELSGSGLSPVPFQPKTVYNGVFQQHSDSVKFRNPFKYQIMTGIKLVPRSNKDTNIFKLLNMNKNKFQIDSFGVLQIPFSFIPNSCSRYCCDILVMISQKIFWTFPIVGVTEVNKGHMIASLLTSCRQSTSSYAQIQLQGIQNFKDNNQYSYMLENIPSIYEKLVQRSFLVDFKKNKLNHANDSLQVQFSFKPMKPLKLSFDLLINRKQGSRWRYKVNVQGTQPQPDDIIQIESNLLVTSTVSFKLTNWEKNTANFKAKFTSDSAHEFSVQPKQGVLSKYGSKGTSFFVSFTPVQYGKQKRGKLIIQTNDMYWSYILKGSLPKYVPPKSQIKRSRISSSIK